MISTHNEPTSSPRQPTADEMAGMQWWNSMTEVQRAEALELAGWKSGGTWTPSAADAWTAHKTALQALKQSIDSLPINPSKTL